MDNQNGLKRPYTGSVRFYKHLILTILALITIIPTSTSTLLCYRQTVLNKKYGKQNELVAQQTECIRGLEVPARPVIEVKNKAGDGGISDTSNVKDSLDWNLMMVNSHTGLPENFTAKLEEAQDEQFVDERIAKPPEEMIMAAADAGMKPHIYSSCRNAEKQQNLFQTFVAQYMAEGDTYNQVFYKTKRKIALPNESEHQTGLMADVIKLSDDNMEDLAEGTTAEMERLVVNRADYGFIQRYPEGKTDITGIDYEPYRYRYVGEEAARVIMDSKIILEEYVNEKREQVIELCTGEEAGS